MKVTIQPGDYPQCIQCGKQFGGSYPACRLVENDLPKLSGIKNAEAQETLKNAFEQIHKMRCEFMNWMITQGFAKPNPKDPMVYDVPEDIELRPVEMAEMENDLIQQAQAGLKGLIQAIVQYIERATRFYFGQQEFLLAKAAKF